jgi:hypothetical protein
MRKGDSKLLIRNLREMAESKNNGYTAVVRQSEQLFCGVKGGFCMYEESDRKCRAEHKCINQITK